MRVVNWLLLICFTILLSVERVRANAFLSFTPNPSLFGTGSSPFSPDTWKGNYERYRYILRAGIGYSMKKRDTLLPLFKPGSLHRIDTEVSRMRIYPDVDTMLTSLYLNEKEASAMMYSHREGGDVLYRDFFKENTHPVVTVRDVVYAKAYISNSLDEDAYEALMRLPKVYDEDVYSQFCDLWGCSVITDATFGGSVEVQISKRVCASIPDADLERDMNIVTTTGKFPDMYYGRYTSTKRVNIVGGNPEITDIEKRIATFVENPVLVYASIIPLHQYLRESNLSLPEYLLLHLERAYSNEMNVARKVLDDMRMEGRRKSIEDLSNRSIYYVITNNEIYASGKGHGCFGVHDGCIRISDGGCRTNACVRIDEAKVLPGSVYVRHVKRYGSSVVIAPERYIYVYRHQSGALQMVIDSEGRREWTSDVYNYGCASFPWRYLDSTLHHIICTNCQPMIKHDGPNEYFDCVCPSF